ncbi:hypothetical protein F5B22DRAFT_650144 [Xylaria bambusicola]|uniref:uncharacterized protein n=1 Tax=Xylaria bambusicola TaxID=326684 RepID=UPI002008218E|nr:uncharacterized protein F5B22DRAFT_650144 [Xylaria bambusicola]KAI0508291.1 hypothetical protein F5B22DRAFT_650144 [Xylaria bambusicola]
MAMMSSSQGIALLAVSVTTMVIALCSCILRYCVRFRINQMIGWEDYFVGGAMFVGIISVSFTIVESVSQDNAQSALQFDYLAQPWLNISSALSKTSIYLLIQRLVSRDRTWRVVLAVQIAFLLVINLAYTITTLLQCRPLEKLWKSDIPGYCWSLSIQQSIGYFQGALDVLTQLFITLFPIMIIQDLEIPGNLRWPFSILSVTSVIVALFGALRTYNISLIQLDERQTFDVIKTILAVLEQNLNIVSANILPIVSLFSKNIRLISQALNDAAEPGERDAASVLSKRSQGSRAGGRRSQGSNVVIESSQRSSAESISSAHDAVITEAWPLRIIKTVSVEIVEEDAPDVPQETDKGSSRTGSRQQNWDTILQK